MKWQRCGKLLHKAAHHCFYQSILHATITYTAPISFYEIVFYSYVLCGTQLFRTHSTCYKRYITCQVSCLLHSVYSFLQNSYRIIFPYILLTHQNFHSVPEILHHLLLLLILFLRFFKQSSELHHPEKRAAALHSTPVRHYMTALKGGPTN